MDKAERIKAFREQVLRISQTQLAQTLGVRQATVSNWETGKTAPDAGYVRLLADLARPPHAAQQWLQGELKHLPQLVPAESQGLGAGAGFRHAAPVQVDLPEIQEGQQGYRRSVMDWLAEDPTDQHRLSMAGYLLGVVRAITDGGGEEVVKGAGGKS